MSNSKEPSTDNTNSHGNFLFRIIQNHYKVIPKIKTEAEINREKWLIPGILKFSRWYLFPAAFIIQFCCGSLYSWSVFNKPIDLLIYGENRNMAPITFYVAVGFLGAAAAVMGPWLERNGPLLTCILGTTLFFIGNLITALALHLKAIWLVFFGYGVFCGFAFGTCYISPVSALQKWFPDRRGFAAGFAVCGFGAGSIVISKIQLPLIHLVGLPLTFVILGSTYFIVMILSALVLRTPPPSSPVASNELTVEANTSPVSNVNPPQMTLVEAITSTEFRLLMFMFPANILFGLVLVSRLSNIVTDVFGKSADEASTIVAVNGGFNLGGRLILSIFSDYIGRRNCFVILLTIQVIILGCFSTMTNHGAYWPFVITMWIVTGCYGSSFGVLPAFLSDKFGPTNIGACHGIVLTGWSLAGVGGGVIFTVVFNSILGSGWLPTDPHPYNINVWWIFGVVCIGRLALIFIKPTPKDIQFNKKWIHRPLNYCLCRKQRSNEC